MSDGARLPFEPPLATENLPGTGGHVGPAPEDFLVDELPAYPAKGSGDHWLVRIKKRSMTTPDAVQRIGRAAGVSDRNIGYAGMKDKHAVTTQWISVPASAPAPNEWQLDEGLEVLEAIRHDRKLRTGHLAGNRFTIRLVDVASPRNADAIRSVLVQRGLPNYFGPQRFGHRGSNVARALAWLDGQRGSAKRQRFYKKLYPSVVQAEIFNRYAARRLGMGADRLLAGEVVRLDGSGSVFVVENPDQELPRLQSGDIHLTGPMIGPKMRSPSAAALELEQQAIGELSLTEAQARALERAAAGTRRDLLVRLDDLQITEHDGALVVGFTLPAGGYATGLLRELTHGPWLDPDQ